VKKGQPKKARRAEEARIKKSQAGKKSSDLDPIRTTKNTISMKEIKRDD